MARRVTWTADEDAELARIYALSSAGRSARALGELAVKKGVDRRCIYGRAERLGLSRVAGSHRPWTQAEDENLQAYAGRIPVNRIAKILARTRPSVRMRLWILKLSGRVKERGYTRIELAELMGVDLQNTLGTMLKRWPMRLNLLGNFSEDEVQLWVWEHLEHLELRKFNQEWLKMLLRRAA